MTNYIAKIDRPIGTIHHGTVYPINYGYIEGLIAGDGEEQDVYILSNLPENQKALKHSLENALLLFTEKMMLKINVY